MGRLPVNDKVLIGLLAACCAIPAIGSGYRMTEIIQSGHWQFEWLATEVDRLPLFLHTAGAVVFLLLGAAQMVPGLRKRYPLWHRRAGRVAALAGLVGALSGLWMTIAHPDISTPVLYYARIAASTLWVVAIVLAIWHVKAKRLPAHRAWMMRAYAMALPAGTLAFILLPVVLIYGEEGNTVLLETIQAAAWPLHLAIAEWLIRRKPGAPKLQRRQPIGV